MANSVLTAVFQSDKLEGVQRLVMLALADNASEQGVCWPSLQTIADRANTSKSYVVRCIEELIEAGYLARKNRYRSSNIYLINLSKLASEKRPDRKKARADIDISDMQFAGETSSPDGVKPVHPEGETSSPSGVKCTGQEPSYEPSFETLIDNTPQPTPPTPAAPAYERPEVAYKERVAAALQRGHQMHFDISQALQEELRVIPNDRAKNWKRTLEHLRAQPDPINGIKTFARYWWKRDWRGKQGQPPTAALIVELWPSATKPAPEEHFVEVYG